MLADHASDELVICISDEMGEIPYLNSWRNVNLLRKQTHSLKSTVIWERSRSHLSYTSRLTHKSNAQPVW